MKLYIKRTNQENIPNFFKLFNLVFFYKQCSYHEEISEKTKSTG